MGTQGMIGRGLAVVALVAAAIGVQVASAPTSGAEDDCTVTPTLVNPCRPWLGVVAGDYPGTKGVRAQYEAHEQRIGKQVDVVHTYKNVGHVTLTADERYFANRGAIVYINWKPATRWVQAGGSDAAVNAQIDTLAAEIKSLGSHRVMLSLHGEPERFTSIGSSTCPGLKGDTGSPAEYRAMWANVQDRFEAKGVTNVVWVMNYLGYQGWDCLFPELWPGNDRVDWITWDPYFQAGVRWDSKIGNFYRALEAKTDAAHAFTSKPWGLAEYASWRGAPQSEAYRMYDDALASLEAGRFPRIKLYEIFDTVNNYDMRVGYDGQGRPDPVEQEKYNAFVHSPAFSESTPPPTTTTTQPPPTTTAPPPVPTNHFATCDAGVETAISCFRGTYRSPIAPTRVTGSAYAGTASVQVRNASSPTGAYGLNVDPRPVPATQVGRTYTGSVWVKPVAAGVPITLLLREARANGTAPANGYTAVKVVPTSTAWRQVTATYVAKEAGSTLSFSVYATLAAAQSFQADAFALTSVPPA